MYVYKDDQRRSRCEHSQGYKHMSACTTWAYIQKYLWWNMYTCEHMYVCKEVLSASTGKGTDRCEFAQHGFTYKSIFDMIYVYLWVYACIQRGSNCEHSQWHVQVWDCTARVGIQRYLWCNICIFVTYVCMQRGSKCEHSQGHRHMLVRTTRGHTQKYLQYEIYTYI